MPSISTDSEWPLRQRLTGSISALAPGATVCVARELTKKFEEFRRGTPAELAAHFTAHPPKGEITLVLSVEEP